MYYIIHIIQYTDFQFLTRLLVWVLDSKGDVYKRVLLYRQRYEYYISNKSVLQVNVLGLRPIGLIF